MNARFLPGLVFVTCMVVGFGVGFEAEGQGAAKTTWTTPDWALPWGMTWPDPVVLEAPEPATEGSDAAELSDVATDPSGDVSAEVGPAQATPEPGVFPGLINPPAEPKSTPEAAAASEQGDGAPSEGAEGAAPPEALTAQLTQLEEVEAQLQRMAEANQAAKAAVTAALAGKARPEPGEPATPEQVQESLALLTDMVKKMKPKTAAELLQQWDDSLAIGILRRLGSRRATPIVSKMPVEVSGRLTSLIAAGVGALPPAIAEGADALPQGEQQ